MPKPHIKKNNLLKVLDDNIELLKKIDSSISINVKNKTRNEDN